MPSPFNIAIGRNCLSHDHRLVEREGQLHSSGAVFVRAAIESRHVRGIGSGKHCLDSRWKLSTVDDRGAQRAKARYTDCLRIFRKLVHVGP